MREDNLDVGVGAHRPRGDEVDGRPRRFMRVVDHGLWEAGIHKCGVLGVRGVDKHHGLARLEQVPGGLEVRVAEVMVVTAVASVEDYSVGMEDVQGILYLRMCRDRVEKRRNVGEESVSRGLG